MKKYSSIQLLTAFALCLASLASCKKLIDVDAPGVLEEKICIVMYTMLTLLSLACTGVF